MGDKQFDRLSVLHWSASWRETARLETALIEKLKRKSRQLNDAPGSVGRWSSSWNCIYLLWADKVGVESNGNRRFLPVNHLHWPIIQPDADSWKKAPPQHLMIGPGLESVEVARAELNEMRERRGVFLAELKSEKPEAKRTKR